MSTAPKSRSNFCNNLLIVCCGRSALAMIFSVNAVRLDWSTMAPSPENQVAHRTTPLVSNFAALHPGGFYLTSIIGTFSSKLLGYIWEILPDKQVLSRQCYIFYYIFFDNY